MCPKQGEIVRSLCGHDAGNCFYVMHVTEEFLFLVDGKHRRVLKPKKKRVRHTRSEGFWPHPVTDRIVKGEPVLDSEIRRALGAFREASCVKTKEV